MLGLGNSITTLPYVEGAVPYSNTKSYDGDLSQTNGVNTNYDSQTLIRSAHSFSCWLKPDDGQPSKVYNIFGVYAGAGAHLSFLQLLTNGTLRQTFYSGGLAIGQFALADTNIAVFQDGAQSGFTHVAVVNDYSGSNVETTFYVNAQAVTTSYLAGFQMTVSNANQFTTSGIETAIDGYAYTTGGPWGPAGGFDGLIDEFAAFTKALSASEVSDIYNSGTPKDESGHDGLELYYRFEDDLTDTAGTSNGSAHGTVTFSSTTP